MWWHLMGFLKYLVKFIIILVFIILCQIPFCVYQLAKFISLVKIFGIKLNENPNSLDTRISIVWIQKEKAHHSHPNYFLRDLKRANIIQYEEHWI